MDRFDVLRIASDLHIGGLPGHRIFGHEDVFARGVKEATQCRAERVGLILNGDIIDFLARPDAKRFDPVGAADEVARLAWDAQYRGVFQALAGFCQTPGRTLVIVLGNHDVELCVELAQHTLLLCLSAADDSEGPPERVRDDVRGRVRFATRGLGYRCEVGGKSVYCFHGDVADEWNAVDHSGLGRARRDLLQGRSPIHQPRTPPGTDVVLDVMNRVKRDYPFVEVLKPEQEMLARLLPVIAPEALSHGVRMSILKSRAATRKVRGHDFLNAQDGDAAPLPAAERVLDDAASLELDVDPLTLVADAGDQELGLFSDSVDGVSRWLTRRLARKDRSWDLDTPDQPLAHADRQGIRADLVVAGHTHLRRLRTRRSGGWYANSGSWAALMRLEEKHLADAETFAVLKERLRTTRYGDLRDETKPLGALVRHRPTWVRVETTGDVAHAWLEDPVAGGGPLGHGRVAL